MYSKIKENVDISVKTIHEFVKEYCTDYPNMVDYLGMDESDFSGENAIIIQNSEFLYSFKEHLDINETKNQIGLGNQLKGKQRISRNNPEEAIITTNFDFDIKIMGFENINRAINGDLVGVELQDEKDWLTVRNLDIDDNAEELTQNQKDEMVFYFSINQKGYDRQY